MNAEFLNDLPELGGSFLATLKIAAKQVGIKRVAIVGGLIRDEIISLIRAASDTASAKQSLQDLHGLSNVQADAILQMQLRRLTALEADKIRLEHEDLLVKICSLWKLLNCTGIL